MLRIFFGRLTCCISIVVLQAYPNLPQQLSRLVFCGEYTVLYIYVFQYIISVFCTVL